MREQTIVGSSNVSGAKYDDDKSELTVTFHHGGSYTFANVPESVYDGLLNAGSAGQYFNQNIKGQFSEV